MGMTRYYVDAAGTYIGAFEGPDEAWFRATVPAGAVQVSHPPINAWDTWDGRRWVAGMPPPVRLSPDVEALAEVLGVDLEAVRTKVVEKRRVPRQR